MNHSYTIKKLNNDSKLLVINVPNSQVAGFSIGVRAGKNYCSKDKAELAHLLEHLMFNGNSKYKSGNDLSYELERYGIVHNGHTAGTHISFEYSFGKDFTESAISVALSQLISPTFSKDLIDNEKNVIKRELEPDLDDNYIECYFGLSNAISEENYKTKERINSLKNISNEDVKKYYKKYFVSKNTNFLIFGSFKENELINIIKLIEGELSNYKEGSKVAIRHPKLKSYQNKVVSMNSQKAERNCFDISFVNSKRPPMKDWPAIEIFYAVYNKGTYSRMFREIRDNGLGYSFRSGYNLSNNYSELFFTDRAYGKNIFSIFMKGLQELKNILGGDFTDKEFERAKGYVLGAYERSYNTPSDFAGWYVTEFADDDELVDFDNYLKEIKNLSKEDVVKASNNFIDLDSWVLSIIGKDIKKLEPEFKKILNSYK